jgi:hypothetical protein
MANENNKLTYFMLSRSIFDSAIWRHDPIVLKIFIYLLGQARHNRKPHKYPTFEIKRGELVTSLSQIAEDNEYILNGALKKISRQKAMRALDKLENEGYIKRISDTYGTHVSICNYDFYQNSDNYKTDSDGTQVEQGWNDTGTEVETNNNDKNVNNDNKEEEEPPKNYNCKKIDLPEDIERELWCEWMDIRKKNKGAMTERAINGIFNKIDELRKKGFQPNDLINTALINGWKTVFEPNLFNSSGNKPKNVDTGDDPSGWLKFQNR